VRWPHVLAVVVMILGSACYLIITSHGGSQAHSQTGARLRDLDLLLHEESTLQWKTLADRTAPVRVAREVGAMRARERTLLEGLHLLPIRERTELEELVDQYHAVLDQQLALIVVGRTAEARTLEWEQTDTRFAQLSSAIEKLSQRSTANAVDADRTADVTLILAMVLCSVMIGALLRRFDTAHRAAAEASAAMLLQERDALHQAVENAAVIRRLAAHDALTGLPNRVLFTERVEDAMRLGGDQAVLFVDLDDFKRVNDSLGHAAGDELLIAVADRLRTSVREGDTAARLGGDEFALLVGAGGEPAAVHLAQRIIAALRLPAAAGGTQVVTNASIGIASADTRDTAELLRNADAAMYAAKGLGKARYAVFEPAMHESVRNRVGIEADLRRAMHDDELILYYQPMVCLDDGTTVGAEALVRWEHPTQGLLSPGAFLPIAEESGLIVPLGRWVLAEACRQTQEWIMAGDADDDFAISVNLSAHQLLHPEIVGEVISTLEATGLDPGALVLEITESAIMHQHEAVAGRLAALRAHGVRIALDDFGTGYSSLSHLQRLPVDQVKVDRSFVAAGDEICSAILALGHTLGLETVAEGIETREQADHVRGLGCRFAQGYWFAKPLPAAIFGDRLRGPHRSSHPALRGPMVSSASGS